MLWSKGITAQTLHLIMVSDVEDKQFGRISLGDETSLMYIAETTQSYLNYQLRTVYLNRRNFTAAAVRKVLDTLRTQPNDLGALQQPFCAGTLALHQPEPGGICANSC